MAIDSQGVGSFIPNAAGIPVNLSLSPVERVQVQAVEKAKGQQVPAQSAGNIQQEELSKATVVQPTSGVGVTVTIDV